MNTTIEIVSNVQACPTLHGWLVMGTASALYIQERKSYTLAIHAGIHDIGQNDEIALVELPVF